MVLVDTSILIAVLKGEFNKKTVKFNDVVDNGIPWGINSYIYQELLQGAKDLKEFKTLQNYFKTQRFYHLSDSKYSFEKAAKIYFSCRKAGYTISSTIDCLIVQTAIENDLFLLHNDVDFDRIKKVITELKIY